MLTLWLSSRTFSFRACHLSIRCSWNFEVQIARERVEMGLLALLPKPSSMMWLFSRALWKCSTCYLSSLEFRSSDKMKVAARRNVKDRREQCIWIVFSSPELNTSYFSKKQSIMRWFFRCLLVQCSSSFCLRVRATLSETKLRGKITKSNEARRHRQMKQRKDSKREQYIMRLSSCSLL